MWETLFDPSMLDSGKEIAIWCPKEDDVDELFAVLRAHGYRWSNGDLLTHKTSDWDHHYEDTVYTIERGRRVMYCSIGWINRSAPSYKKCVFNPLAAGAVEVGDLI